jgi:ABC-2 type transport system permease protein
MRTLTFANRNFKEIIRDPLNLSFLFGFPIVLLLLLSAIQANIPVSMFEIAHLAPGIAVFGLAFMTLFSATVIAKDRQSSFMHRLYTTPMSPVDFILGYTLPLIPIALAEGIATYIFAVILGLDISVNILLSLILLIPVALLYIALGLLCGSVFNDKQVGGICGALLTNLSAWLSGIWFDLDLVGGAFKKISYALPFVHSVEMQRAIIAGDYAGIFPHLGWVLGYAVAILTAAVLLFLRQMKRQ